MNTSQEIISAATIDAIVPYTEGLLGIDLKYVKKNRYSAPCPFHADNKDNFILYVNKKNETRFHCFGACKGDWNIYDLIMLCKKNPLIKARQIWAEHLGVADLDIDAGGSRSLPEPGETPEPDDTACFVEPKRLNAVIVDALEKAADFYHNLLLSNENQFKPIWDYLARRGVGKEIIVKFHIGYAPPYSNEQYQGRSLIDAFLPRFEKDHETFNVFTDAGLVRLLNDNSANGYGYYCRQIDFRREYPFSRNYGDTLAGQMIFPIYDAEALPTGPVALMGRRPDDRGVRWLKHQAREVPLAAFSRLYGLEKAAPYIRQYRTIILVEGLFDYFGFYNLLQDQDKTVVVSTLGTYITPEAATLLKKLDIEHFIVAFEWDELGRNGIERMAAQSGGMVYYLGGPEKDQSPYDILKPVVGAISGFSINKGD